LVEGKAEALMSVQALIARNCTARAEERATAEKLNRRLQDEVARNRRLLERALHVQGRILGMIARAVPRAVAANATRYGAKGGIPAQDLKKPVALSSRA
jgi:glucose-6-phosphate-specific signal transduction histidine kinase